AKDLTPVVWSKAEPPQGALVAVAGDDGKAVAIGMITSEPRQFRVGGTNPAMQPTERAYFGISVGDAPKGGIRIDAVRPGTPAEKAGLKVGDVIRKVGETEINNSDQLGQALRKLKPGDKVEVTLRRGDKTQTLDVTLGKAPQEEKRASYDRW